MQFLITAFDGTDSEALDRRMAARPAHLEYAGKAREAGKFIIGGAILDDDGKMIGSMLVVDFPSKEAIEKEWFAEEPYVTGNVWQKIDIRPYRVAEVFVK
jgi:uncharacterized protein YciI